MGFIEMAGLESKYFGSVNKHLCWQDESPRCDIKNAVE